jgi:hypothetical protein
MANVKKETNALSVTLSAISLVNIFMLTENVIKKKNASKIFFYNNKIILLFNNIKLFIDFHIIN